MKEYSGYDTAKFGRLIDDINKTKGNNTLYVSDCFFALNDGNTLSFYYNPNYFWDKILISELDKSVLDNLAQDCSVFRNFQIDENSKNKPFEGWDKHKSFFPETPKIGNHYSCLGNRIITHHKKIYFIGDYGGCLTQDIRNLSAGDMSNILYWAVMTKTPNFIKSVYELDCFKREQMKNYSKTIIGAIAGDVIGSVYEWNNVKTTEFALFTANSKYTDDTVLTVAIADCILNTKDFTKTVWEYGRKYYGRGYGGRFKEWLQNENPQPYNSFGNGSAMRVSAVGFAFNDIETVLQKAKETAEITHNHIEGIKGAQATAIAIYLAKTGKSKTEIKDYISTKFNYNLDFTIEQIRPTYQFDVTCQGSVPQAIVAFLQSNDYESAIRLAISIGGDSDTIACIAGGIASAYYGDIPENILEFVITKLPSEFIDILNKFDKQFIVR